MFPSLIHMLFTFAHLYFERARVRTRNGNRRLVQEPRWGSAKTAVQHASRRAGHFLLIVACLAGFLWMQPNKGLWGQFFLPGESLRSAILSRLFLLQDPNTSGSFGVSFMFEGSAPVKSH